MSTEELLQPRRKVSEEGYPDMIFLPGQIIELKKWDEESKQWYWLSPKKNRWYEPFFDRFPSIFIKLFWWQGRKPEEMPRYLKDKSGNKVYSVYKHFSCTYPQSIRTGESDFFDDPNCWLREHDYAQNYSFYLPATEEEYNQYQSSINISK